MELQGYITKGEDLLGGRTQLAEHLGIRPNQLTDAKAGRNGIPGFACVILAQLLDEVECRVIAASELVTETNPERRAVWLPFVQGIATSARKRAAAETKAKARKVSRCCPAASKPVDALR